MSSIVFTKEPIQSIRKSVGLLVNRINEITRFRSIFQIPPAMYKMLRSGCRTVIVIGDNDKIYALKNKIVLTNCESDTFNELTFFIEPGIVVGHIEAAISQICDLSDVQRAALADEYLKTLPGFLYKSPAGFISAHNDQLIRVITIVSSAPS